MDENLTDEQMIRYNRHIILPEVGVKGQKKLLDSSALIVGAGGLGSPVSLYLAAAGIGKLGIIDMDKVDVSNLQRQILYDNNDIGAYKVDAAKERLKNLNPDTEIENYRKAITPKNARDLIKKYDIILDGSDNLSTRFLLNDACVLEDTPLVYGSIFRYEGQASIFHASKGPCYRCVFRSQSQRYLAPSCQDVGVLGVISGIVGSIQATEAIKYLLELGESLIGKMIIYDALKMEFETISIQKSKDCPSCSKNSKLIDLTKIDYGDFSNLTLNTKKAVF